MAWIATRYPKGVTRADISINYFLCLLNFDALVYLTEGIHDTCILDHRQSKLGSPRFVFCLLCILLVLEYPEH